MNRIEKLLQVGAVSASLIVGGGGGLAQDKKEPQQKEEVKKTIDERMDAVRNLKDEAKEVNESQEASYEEYLKSEKDSQEEKTIFEKLKKDFTSINALRSEINKYAKDEHAPIRILVLHINMALDENDKKHLEGCGKSGKDFWGK